ncbi:unnamed protein product [Soboliphyme baturini]|uniref:Uncharacterized protein n=1 Tax=Soboliphyme baturini TaxID=241478 RepID=A0A183IP30_9BILA|nr:unnamed protein product [Soboliphyme baturini]
MLNALISSDNWRINDGCDDDCEKFAEKLRYCLKSAEVNSDYGGPILREQDALPKTEITLNGEEMEEFDKDIYRDQETAKCHCVADEEKYSAESLMTTYYLLIACHVFCVHGIVRCFVTVVTFWKFRSPSERLQSVMHGGLN